MTSDIPACATNVEIRASVSGQFYHRVASRRVASLRLARPRLLWIVGTPGIYRHGGQSVMAPSGLPLTAGSVETHIPSTDRCASNPREFSLSE